MAQNLGNCLLQSDTYMIEFHIGFNRFCTGQHDFKTKSRCLCVYLIKINGHCSMDPAALELLQFHLDMIFMQFHLDTKFLFTFRLSIAYNSLYVRIQISGSQCKKKKIESR